MIIFLSALPAIVLIVFAGGWAIGSWTSIRSWSRLLDMANDRADRANASTDHYFELYMSVLKRETDASVDRMRSAGLLDDMLDHPTG